MNFLHDIFDHHWMFILFSILYIGLEFFFPIVKKQKFLREEFGQDVFWYVLNNIYIDRWLYYFLSYISFYFLPLWGRYVLHHITPDSWLIIQTLPFKIENVFLLAIILFVAIDFFAYWLHYLNHRIPILWNIHILHHSPRKLDWLSGTRAYWLDGLLSRMMASFVLIFIDVSEEGLTLLALWDTQVQFFTHSNIKLRLGPLEKILNNTHAHWWHHDVNTHHRYGQNFGQYTLIWDKLFKTYYVENDYPEKLGLKDEIEYPRSMIARFFYPIIKLSFVSKLLSRQIKVEDDTI